MKPTVRAFSAIRVALASVIFATLMMAATAPAAAAPPIGGTNDGNVGCIAPSSPYTQNNYPRTSTMPSDVQRVQRYAQKVERIGVLPNGDEIRLATGLTSITDSTKVNLGGGISTVYNGYITGECLLLYSAHFERWDVLVFNPSASGTDSSYSITSAKILPNWNIAVTFTNKKRTIKAEYVLNIEQFVFNNPQEQQLVEGVPGVYFGSLN